MGYSLLINGVYLGYNPLTNHLLTSWDIQAGGGNSYRFFFLIFTPKLGEDLPNLNIFQMGLSTTNL